MKAKSKVRNQKSEEKPSPGPAVGMSLRDYFAGQALQGLLAGKGVQDFVYMLNGYGLPPKAKEEAVGTLAAGYAYKLADAMLQRRVL